MKVLLKRLMRYEMEKQLDNVVLDSAMIVGRNSGLSYEAIGKVVGLNRHQVSKRINARPDDTDMFFKGNDGVYEIEDPYSKISTNGILVAENLIVTGDLKDGVIQAHEYFSLNMTTGNLETTVEKFGDYVKYSLNEYMTRPDVGVLGTLRIGKLELSGDSCDFDHKGNEINPDKITEVVLEEGRIADYSTLEYAGKNAAIQDLIQNALDKNVAEVEKLVEVEEPTVAAPTFDVEPIWNASNKFISITIGRDTYNADNDHPNFQEALEACIKGNIHRALELINIKKGITSYVNGNIEIKDDRLLYKGIELRTGLTTRIINAMTAGEEFKFFLPFLENLMENPSRKAVTRLFDFLVANDIEITEDGHFLAWKYVREDYKDVHTGTMDNSPGTEVRVNRWEVDENDNVTCSHGLHVCSKSYLQHMGSGKRVVKVKVHPKDVVSIPVDYNDAKMRTCGYVVLEDVTDKMDLF